MTTRPDTTGLTKTTGPAQMIVTWDGNGNVTDISFSQSAVITDSTNGISYTRTRGPNSWASPGQTILNVMAQIYAALPSSGL